jgi:hypothetical protein
MQESVKFYNDNISVGARNLMRNPNSNISMSREYLPHNAWIKFNSRLNDSAKLKIHNVFVYSLLSNTKSCPHFLLFSTSFKYSSWLFQLRLLNDSLTRLTQSIFESDFNNSRIVLLPRMKIFQLSLFFLFRSMFCNYYKQFMVTQFKFMRNI